jgi:hypothetical protein
VPATTCGHDCCVVAGNRYHAHAATPETCEHCVDARHEIDDLGDIVTAVVDRVAPQIPGLPTDPDAMLVRVIDVTARVHEAARHEAEVERLSPRRRRTVLAARVGLALAFPDRFPAPVRAIPPREP